jgi:site-specific recombinase XerD
MTQPHQSPDFATLVRDFFCDRLINQQHVSPHTVAAYRDTIRLLLAYAQKHRRVSQASLKVDDIDAPLVVAFLDDLEQRRGNSIRTRNARLTAIRAFIQYVAQRDPVTLPLAQRITAIPNKRFDQPLLEYLTRNEIEAVLNATDRADWSGRRDRALFTVIYNTGARVSEAIGIAVKDLALGPCSSVRIHGKGRKDRCVPLWTSTAKLLSAWLSEIPVTVDGPLFPNRFGRRLSRSGVEDRLQRAVQAASANCASLRSKNVSPHTLRHTTAMHLLQAGVDITLIALWLGHESPETTHLYVEADLEMKRRVLDRLDEPSIKKISRPPAKTLFDFLDSL